MINPLLASPVAPHATQGEAFALVAILIVAVIALAVVIVIASRLVGPNRSGPIKDSTYESGVDPVGDTRRRFNVGFYMVAMLFLLFDVEIVFFYPWAILFPRLTAPRGDAQRAWADAMIDAGYTAPFLLSVMFVFVGILLVGYVYAWRKGVFRWS